MCQKLPYCGVRIDSCIEAEIDKINLTTQFRTILSCCGHNIYPKTIIVVDTVSNNVIEYFSQVFLSNGIRKSRKYYKKDDRGYYYIPEILAKNKFQR